MCGILGGVFRRPVADGDVQAFRRAIRTLEHRGPDAEGIEVVPEANAVLAFRRLAIIDLATGDQPMSTDRGQHIIFNGEIYNYRDLRQAMVSRGVPLRTTSDTEVLLHALTESGIQGMEPLRGMWGLAFLDTVRRRLLLVRDRLGVKQLYYTEMPEGIFFASEPKALIALPWVKAEFAEEQLPAYFTFRAAPAPATLFRGISKLAAGSCLTHDLDSGRSRVEPYWHLPTKDDGTRIASVAEAVDAVDAALLEGIKRRLVADVPVGAFLSGGLDSSLVVAGMRRLGHGDVKTFSATFPGSPDNEAEFSQRVARRFETVHHEAPAAPGEFLTALPRWTELNDDLVADASSLPLLAVSRVARDSGCIVMLSGEGSDELFGGYGSYHKFVLLSRLARLVPGAGPRQAIASGMVSAGLLGRQDLPRVMEYFVRRRGYMGTAAVLDSTGLGELLPGTPAAEWEQLPRARGSDLAALGAFDFERRIPDDLLVRTDRATMGASIEARVPFLDQDLVALMPGLPEKARAVPGVSKVALRIVARRWGVPNETITHRKIGFQLPLGDWFRGPLRPMWARILEQRVIPGLGYERVASILEAHQQGKGRFEEVLWRVAALELWHRRWIQGDPTGLPS